MGIEELGKRAVVCKHWRWLPGMAFDHKDGRTGRTVLRPLAGEVCAVVGELRGLAKTHVVADDIVPDLSDPATLGCLLRLVRDAYVDQRLWAFPVEDKRGNWSVTVRTTPQAWFYGNTEAEALVAALEAAP